MLFDTKGRKLFLDDERQPPTLGWDVVRSYNAFVRYFETHEAPRIISFDHDLAFEHYPLAEQRPGDKIPYHTYKELTGYHAVKWLLERGTLPEVACVHTLNPVGAQNIIGLLRDKCTVVHWPHGSRTAVRVYYLHGN